VKKLSQKPGAIRQRRHQKYRDAGISIARAKVGPEAQEMLIRNGWLRENWTPDDLNEAVTNYLNTGAATTSVLPPKADIKPGATNVRS